MGKNTREEGWGWWEGGAGCGGLGGFLVGKLRQGGGFGVPTAAPQRGRGVFCHLVVAPKGGGARGVTLLGSWARTHWSLRLNGHSDQAGMVTVPKW